ncbi:hypothetical protein F0L17_04435 [Streptomyces sp. TRM43335]|uniref:Uncharacterized protein n=1 Tax=Streptomyces taklimakanensis TaxID=2569853 RepID=A0A6G2B802_9ACTN|nr:hypothetical protein [Streptomyces taklimakanensis]MTE18388.1 hypothetical protein [Streptomyces taklimakanensis]
MTDGVARRGPAAARLPEAVGGRAAARVRRLLSAGARGIGGAGTRLGGAGRPVTVGESVDVGVPVREAYDRWLEFLEGDGARRAPRAARLLWPARGREVRVTERITDDLVVWSARAARETVRGTATFHEVAENLTRVLLVLECRPRSAGPPVAGSGLLRGLRSHRARRDLADFRHAVTMGIEIDGGSASGHRAETEEIEETERTEEVETGTGTEGTEDGRADADGLPRAS